MSDNVVKLRIDSKEYTANIKRAGQALTDFFGEIRAGRKAFEDIDNSTLEAIQAMGELGTQTNSTRGSLKELQQATADMTVAYRALSDEEKNSPVGQAMARSIAQMTERAGQMKDAMVDVEASIRNASSDTRAFDQLAGAMGLATSGFQTFQGAAKMLGIEVGNDVEVIAKLQAAMAVTNGLTQIQTALQKQSAVMQGVMAIQTKANAIAQSLLAKNTALATAAGKAFNLVAKANPIGLLVTGIMAAVGAVAAFSKKTKELTEEQKRMAEQAEISAQRSKAMSEAVGTATGNLVAKFMALQSQWTMLRSDMERSQWLKEHTSDFRSLGLAVKSVSDAENVLVNMAPQVIEALRSVAEASAFSELYQEAIKKREKEWGQYAQWTLEKGYGYEPVTTREKNNMYQSVPEEWKNSGLQAGRDYSVFTSEVMNRIKTEYQLTQAGVDKINQYRQKKQQERQQQLRKDADDEVNYYLGKYTEAERKSFNARKNIKYFSTGSETGVGNINKTAKTTAKEAKAVWETGLSIQSSAGINAFIGDLQKSLDNADFGSVMYNSLAGQLADMKTLQSLVSESMKAGLGTSLFDLADDLGQDFWTRAMSGSVEDTDWRGIVDLINEKLLEAGLDEIELDFATGEVKKKQQKEEKEEKPKQDKTVAALEKFNGDYQKVVSGVGSITSGLQQMGVEIPKEIQNVVGVLSGISSLVTGVTSILSLILVAENTTATATALTAAETSVKTIPLIGWALAGGGIVHAAGGYEVPGNNYSGDLVPALLNSGELVLNKSQQNNLASQLQGGGLQNLHLTATAKGEDLILSIERTGKRKGYGEMVWWK